MAAEGFFIDKVGSKNFAGDLLVKARVQGKGHSSKFTRDGAENFSCAVPGTWACTTARMTSGRPAKPSKSVRLRSSPPDRIAQALSRSVLRLRNR